MHGLLFILLKHLTLLVQGNLRNLDQSIMSFNSFVQIHKYTINNLKYFEKQYSDLLNTICVITKKKLKSPSKLGTDIIQQQLGL